MNLKEMRQVAGYTQKAIAQILPNVSQGLISQWESGECSPHSSKILDLAELYGVTSDDILMACKTAKLLKESSKKTL